MPISKELTVVAIIDIEGQEVDIRALVEGLSATPNCPSANYEKARSAIRLRDKVLGKSASIVFSCFIPSFCSAQDKLFESPIITTSYLASAMAFDQCCYIDNTRFAVD